MTELAGTTRDILHADIDIDSFLSVFMTRRGYGRRMSALSRRVFDAPSKPSALQILSSAPAQPVMIAPDDTTFETGSARVIEVGTRSDLGSRSVSSAVYDIEISTLTGEGLSALRALLIRDLQELTTRSLSMPVRDRQVLHLRQALERISDGVSARSSGLELRSEYLRHQASHILGRITGRVDVENLLDVIFSEFCVGK